MALIPSKLKDKYISHVSAVNPHGVTSKQIWGLYNVENIADSDKKVSDALYNALSDKVNILDVYDSTEESQTIDLTKAPWSAKQGYSMDNVINTWKMQDTSEIEKRITWCENNV